MDSSVRGAGDDKLAVRRETRLCAQAGALRQMFFYDKNVQALVQPV